MRILAVLALTTGCMSVESERGPCNNCPATGPSSVAAPGNDVFVSVRNRAASFDVTTESTLSIDLGECDHRRYHKSLDLGSAWFLVHPHSPHYCELWLGGETENPSYTGEPAQYCLFDRTGKLDIDMRQSGGPIVLANQPSCVSF